MPLPKLVYSALLGVAMSASALAHDKTDNYLTSETLSNILNSSVKIDSKLVLVETKEEKGKLVIKGSGSGVVLKDSQTEKLYVLTAGHVASPVEAHEMVKSGFYEIDDYSMYVNGARVNLIKRDLEYDLALLEIPMSLPSTPARKIVNAPEISDYVVGAGYPGVLGRGINFDGRALVDASEIAEGTIMIDSHISSGQSGSPVYVFDKGIPSLVGIISYKMQDVSYMAGIVPGKIIRNFLKGTALEDEYIGNRSGTVLQK